MRNLGDLNDLYNTQDVILLCEIIESRFQAMQNTFGFNRRKCNSPSDLPFAIYFDFETTKLTGNCLDPEQKNMFVVSYAMIVAFNPSLNLDRIIIYISFGHSLEHLSNLDYLSREQITFIDPYLIHMLKDAACKVSKRNYKNSLEQMFPIESAMV